MNIDRKVGVAMITSQAFCSAVQATWVPAREKSVPPENRPCWDYKDTIKSQRASLSDKPCKPHRFQEGKSQIVSLVSLPACGLRHKATKRLYCLADYVGLGSAVSASLGNMKVYTI